MNNAILTGKEIARLMRVHHRTIREVAASMQITPTRVRFVREHGVEGRGYVCDWYEAITGVCLYDQLRVHEGFGFAV